MCKAFLQWIYWSINLLAASNFHFHSFLWTGHINHSIFRQNLAPVREGGGEPPKGSLGWAIDEHFGSLEGLISKMNAEGAALQGSGLVWLGLDKELKKLVVETTPNQDPPPPGDQRAIGSINWYGCMGTCLLFTVQEREA